MNANNFTWDAYVAKAWERAWASHNIIRTASRHSGRHIHRVNDLCFAEQKCVVCSCSQRATQNSWFIIANRMKKSYDHWTGAVYISLGDTCCSSERFVLVGISPDSTERGQSGRFQVHVQECALSTQQEIFGGEFVIAFWEDSKTMRGEQCTQTCIVQFNDGNSTCICSTFNWLRPILTSFRH